MSVAFLLLASFLASTVEFVEATTIVLAVGVTRSWRSALIGVAAATVALAVVVAALGPALTLIPIAALRLVIGTLLLIFGLQWLRKAILRASGLKAMHNEDEIYQKEVARLGAIPDSTTGRDATAFTVAFKGVVLEGLEVVIVVLTLGVANHRLALAAYAAAAAVLIIGLIGVVVSRQLSKVPENAMKMAVGLMLVSFGSFWSGEGMGVHWPLSDLSILGLIALYGLATFIMIKVLGGVRPRLATVEEAR